MKTFSKYCVQRLTEAEDMRWHDLPPDLRSLLESAEIPKDSKVEKLDRYIYVYPSRGQLIRQQLQILIRDNRFISVGTGLEGFPFGTKGIRMIFRAA